MRDPNPLVVTAVLAGLASMTTVISILTGETAAEVISGTALWVMLWAGWMIGYRSGKRRR